MLMLTRKLLRDWKTLNRHPSSLDTKEKALFCIRPQDSNLHVWHLVIFSPVVKVELYLKLYIGDEDEPTIIVKCLSPNTVFPVGRSISLTHLNYFLVEDGFLPLVQQIWKLFFDDCGYVENPRLTFAWNRIMCKEFRVNFPELLGNLVSGDYTMVKNYYNDSNARRNPNIAVDNIEPILTTPIQASFSNGGTMNTIACDAFPKSQKRDYSEDDDESSMTKKLKR